MKARLLDVLACPHCKEHLDIAITRNDDQGNVEDGSLTCEGCSRTYPVTRGIPRFNDGSDQVAEHFANEFLQLATNDLDMDPVELLSFFFYTRSGIDPEIYKAIPGDPYRTELPGDAAVYRPERPFFQGKVCLDAGCGPGRFISVVAQQGAEYVIGLDLGEHVDRAAARCQHLGNVDFVQGSILEPPFKEGSFGFVYSIGVLHHTPDPRGGCRRLVDLVEVGGGMSVWVYPEEYWGGALRKPLTKAIHWAVSHLSPRRGFWVCKRILFPIGRLLRILARRRWTKLLFAPLFLTNIPRHPRDEVMLATIYDYFAPPLISTHTYEEVAGWFADSFDSLKKVEVPVGWFAEGLRDDI